MDHTQSLSNQQALTPYKKAIARYVRASMALKGMRYGDLAQALAERGISMTPENLRSKVSKCMFSADLLAAIIDAMSAEDSAMLEILKQARELQDRGLYADQTKN
ncbi:DUF6471 domain-containing protein [Microbulbifer sp. OS29]|uniref:DUF6471 domain-containing protein n=1 Tax=Microbulbifer okhotskensis TaxID=2926617 RepID=A0A9X2ELN4_9GAMM|nr:DUF6471 domain-containing protein [Microbulbifer okhotskensis]MCO1333320.1 DUF6471 domain-containing protein [Microbulbifer okhotskensis]